MCGRYTVAIQAQEVAEELRAAIHMPADAPARFNVAPTQDAPIAIELAAVEHDPRRIGLARFGLVPAESEGPKAVGARYINLRSENVAGQQAFAESAATRRCLVVADGFYEWKKPEEGAKSGKKQPYFFRPAKGGLLTFAGIWDMWKAPEGDRLPSFAILTAKPYPEVGAVHDRMPLIVPPAFRDRWLSPDEHDARALLRELRDAQRVPLESYPVSPRVGSVANDDPSLIERVDPGSPSESSGES